MNVELKKINYNIFILAFNFLGKKYKNCRIIFNNEFYKFAYKHFNFFNLYKYGMISLFSWAFFFFFFFFIQQWPFGSVIAGLIWVIVLFLLSLRLWPFDSVQCFPYILVICDITISKLTGTNRFSKGLYTWLNKLSTARFKIEMQRGCFIWTHL